MLTTVLSTVLVVACPQDQEPKTTTRLLPLQHLATRELDLAPPPWGSMLTRRESYTEYDLVLARASGDELSVDSVAEALANSESNVVDDERLFLQETSGSLLAVGDAAAIERIERRLHDAQAVFGRAIQVEVTAWDAADGVVPRAVMSPTALAAFRDGREPLWRAVTTTRAAQPTTLDHTTWTRYVRGIEVEVAQKEAISRPVTDLFGTGGHVALRVHPLIDVDEFAVTFQFAASAARGEPQSLQTGMPGAADLQLPQLESYFAACSGRVPNGGALAVTMRGNAATGGQMVLTLRVLAKAERGALHETRAALLPVSALTTDALRRSPPIPSPNDDDMHDDMLGDEERRFGHLSDDHIVDLAHGVLESNEDGENEYGAQVAGGYLYVQGSPGSIAKITALLKTLQERVVQTVEVRHVGTLEPQDGGGLHWLNAPTLLGREVSLVRVLETNVVADVNVEVAQEASSLEPYVRMLQSGTWLRARVLPNADELHLELDLLSAAAPRPSMRSVMPGGGVLMPTSLATTRVDHHGCVAPQAVVEHGDGPSLVDDGRRRRTQLTTSLIR